MTNVAIIHFFMARIISIGGLGSTTFLTSGCGSSAPSAPIAVSSRFTRQGSRVVFNCMCSEPRMCSESRLLRGRGRSQIWRQNREFADLFPLHDATQVGVIHHPNLGNDFADQLTVTEEPHHRTLRDDNPHGFGNCTHIGGGNVTAAESERDVHLRGYRVEVAAGGEENSFPTDDEPTVQLRQFFDGSAEIEIRDMP